MPSFIPLCSFLNNEVTYAETRGVGHPVYKYFAIFPIFNLHPTISIMTNIIPYLDATFPLKTRHVPSFYYPQDLHAV